MLFIEHYQGDTGYIWVPPVRAFRHSTFRLVASAPFYIISWSPLSHESEVPAYIKKRQVPFLGLGRIRAMLGAVVLTCYLLCANQRCECEIRKDQHGVLFLGYTVFYSESKVQYWNAKVLKLYPKRSTAWTKRMDYDYNKRALTYSKYKMRLNEHGLKLKLFTVLFLILHQLLYLYILLTWQYDTQYVSYRFILPL